MLSNNNASHVVSGDQQLNEYRLKNEKKFSLDKKCGVLQKIKDFLSNILACDCAIKELNMPRATKKVEEYSREINQGEHIAIIEKELKPQLELIKNGMAQSTEVLCEILNVSKEVEAKFKGLKESINKFGIFFDELFEAQNNNNKYKAYQEIEKHLKSVKKQSAKLSAIVNDWCRSQVLEALILCCEHGSIMQLDNILAIHSLEILQYAEPYQEEQQAPRTPLIVACQAGRYDVVSHLIEIYHADVNLGNMSLTEIDQKRASVYTLPLSAASENEKIKEYLKDRGARLVDFKLISNKSIKIFALLHERGLIEVSQGYRNFQIVQRALEKNYINELWCLLQYGLPLQSEDAFFDILVSCAQDQDKALFQTLVKNRLSKISINKERLNLDEKPSFHAHKLSILKKIANYFLQKKVGTYLINILVAIDRCEKSTLGRSDYNDFNLVKKLIGTAIKNNLPTLLDDAVKYVEKNNCDQNELESFLAQMLPIALRDDQYRSDIILLLISYLGKRPEFSASLKLILKTVYRYSEKIVDLIDQYIPIYPHFSDSLKNKNEQPSFEIVLSFLPWMPMPIPEELFQMLLAEVIEQETECRYLLSFFFEVFEYYEFKRAEQALCQSMDAYDAPKFVLTQLEKKFISKLKELCKDDFVRFFSVVKEFFELGIAHNERKCSYTRINTREKYLKLILEETVDGVVKLMFDLEEIGESEFSELFSLYISHFPSKFCLQINNQPKAARSKKSEGLNKEVWLCNQIEQEQLLALLCKALICYDRAICLFLIKYYPDVQKIFEHPYFIGEGFSLETKYQFVKLFFLTQKKYSWHSQSLFLLPRASQFALTDIYFAANLAFDYKVIYPFLDFQFLRGVFLYGADLYRLLAKAVDDSTKNSIKVLKRYLIYAGANFVFKSFWKERAAEVPTTPLIEACRSNKIEIVNELLKWEIAANVNYTNLGVTLTEGQNISHFCSPLMAASGNEEIKKMLERHGAQLIPGLNMNDYFVQQYAMYAIEHNNSHLFMTLFTIQDLELLEKYRLVLSRVINTADVVCLRKLLEDLVSLHVLGQHQSVQGFLNEPFTEEPTTLLIQACKQENPAIVSLLIEYGADVNQANIDLNEALAISTQVYETPLLAAALAGHTHLLTLLKNKGAVGCDARCLPLMSMRALSTIILLLQEDLISNISEEMSFVIAEMIFTGNYLFAATALMRGFPIAQEEDLLIFLESIIRANLVDLLAQILSSDVNSYFRSPEIMDVDFAEFNELAVWSYYLNQGFCSEKPTTLLNTACELGLLKMIDLLIFHGAEVNLGVRYDGQVLSPPLLVALLRDQARGEDNVARHLLNQHQAELLTVKHFIAKSVDCFLYSYEHNYVDKRNPLFGTALMQRAIENKHDELLQAFFDIPTFPNCSFDELILFLESSCEDVELFSLAVQSLIFLGSGQGEYDSRSPALFTQLVDHCIEKNDIDLLFKLFNLNNNNFFSIYSLGCGVQLNETEQEAHVELKNKLEKIRLSLLGHAIGLLLTYSRVPLAKDYENYFKLVKADDLGSDCLHMAYSMGKLDLIQALLRFMKIDSGYQASAFVSIIEMALDEPKLLELIVALRFDKKLIINNDDRSEFSLGLNQKLFTMIKWLISEARAVLALKIISSHPASKLNAHGFSLLWEDDTSCKIKTPLWNAVVDLNPVHKIRRSLWNVALRLLNVENCTRLQFLLCDKDPCAELMLEAIKLRQLDLIRALDRWMACPRKQQNTQQGYELFIKVIEAALKDSRLFASVIQAKLILTNERSKELPFIPLLAPVMSVPLFMAYVINIMMRQKKEPWIIAIMGVDVRKFWHSYQWVNQYFHKQNSNKNSSSFPQDICEAQDLFKQLVIYSIEQQNQEGLKNFSNLFPSDDFRYDLYQTAWRKANPELICCICSCQMEPVLLAGDFLKIAETAINDDELLRIILNAKLFSTEKTDKKFSIMQWSHQFAYFIQICLDKNKQELVQKILNLDANKFWSVYRKGFEREQKNPDKFFWEGLGTLLSPEELSKRLDRNQSMHSSSPSDQFTPIKFTPALQSDSMQQDKEEKKEEDVAFKKPTVPSSSSLLKQGAFSRKRKGAEAKSDRPNKQSIIKDVCAQNDQEQQRTEKEERNHPNNKF